MDKLDEYNISASKRSFGEVIDKVNSLLETKLSK